MELENFTETEIKNIITQSANISEAARKLGMNPRSGTADRTVRKYMKRLNCQTMNRGADNKLKGKIKYSKEQMEEVAKNSFSMAEMMRKLNLKDQSGESYRIIHKCLKFYNIDTSHFTGMLWSKGKELGPVVPLEDYLSGKKKITSHKLRLRLIKYKIFPKECSICKRTSWQDQSISLELDHINGDHEDNRLENLRIICCNCHAFTPTYRGRNKVKSEWRNIKYFENITNEKMIEAIKNNKSILEVLKYLELNYKDKNCHKALRKFILDSQIDFSHFINTIVSTKNIDINLYFSNKIKLNSDRLRKKLFKEKIFERKCSRCNFTKWDEKPIPLELDHIDGNHFDNSLSNLRILCPNCHSLTPTYKVKNIKKI